MAFCVQGDLEVALGGADVLRQLADPTGSGLASASVVTDYLESGAAEVRSALEIKHDPEAIATLDSGSLRRLSDANAAVSSRIAYEKGGKGMSMPEWVRDRAERTDRFLDDLAKGFRRLGRVAGGVVASVNQPAQVVQFDPDESNAIITGSKISINNFKKGFR